MTISKLSDSPSMNLFVETEEERWNRLFNYVREHFSKVKKVERSSFPANFELGEYEELMEWRHHCDNCKRPEKCPHYGYRGRIQIRRTWQGRDCPDGIFIPEYYGGKCALFLKALREIREKKEKTNTSPERESTMSFRC